MIFSFLFDGPYTEWLEDKKQLKVFYLVFNNFKKTLKKIEKIFDVENKMYAFKGFFKDKKKYDIQKEHDIPKAIFDNVNKILAISDIHGEYEQLIILLKNNNIIDKKLNWIWNDGHLVFIGDIFDRGSRVTECLWLIYKLEQQAKIKGGNIHYILGNHELMELSNDCRYLNDKYIKLFAYLDTQPSELYGSNTVLGDWIRTKNTLVKINDILFVHAGISPEFLAMKLDIDSVNNFVRSYVKYIGQQVYSGIISLFFKELGPFWYRGYISECDKLISQNIIDETLNFYSVERIVFGHTRVNNIDTTCNNKLINIHVPFMPDNKYNQALLIEEGNYYRIFSNGKREIISTFK
ncbi:MAG: metallophosphoesterase [Bacteroidales bacterium]|nr:metallophosphoesterase [Bacteroidales bacterium]